MSKSKTTKPLRVEFEIEKKVTGEEQVTITRSIDGNQTETKKIYTSQAEAMDLALIKAKEMGYAKVSLQNYTEDAYLFLAYDLISKE